MEIVGALLIGLVGGVGAGLAGIGGGTVNVPALVFLLGFPQHLAQGTSLLAIIFTSTAGTTVNHRNKNVDVRLALTVGVIGAVAAFIAARLASNIDGATLRRLFGVLLLFSGSRMLFQGYRARRAGTVAE